MMGARGTVNCDVLVIGAGPGGLAAAKGAREAGARRVIVLERDACPGGILNQCIHDGFGLIRYKEQVPEGDMLLVPLGHQNAVELYDLFEYAGLEPIDYANGTASLDEKQMKKIADAAKAYFREERAFYMDNTLGVALVERKGLFVGELNATYSVYGLMRGLRSQGETPLIFAIPDCRDGVTARICSLVMPTPLSDTVTRTQGSPSSFSSGPTISADSVMIPFS